MNRLCQSEIAYREMENKGVLKAAISSYALGRRVPSYLTLLARARVYSVNIGEWIPLPSGFDRLTWHDILDNLVRRMLGNLRCLDCSCFFNAERKGGTCFVGKTSHVPFCPKCGSVYSEAIGCTIKGVVQ